MPNASFHKNLRLLWWLRCIAVAGQAAAVLVTTRLLGIPLLTTPLWAIIGGLAIVNCLTGWRIKKARHIAEEEFFVQLLIDMAALFGLLYFTGGASNPFASLFILQVIIAAITLRALYTWTAAAITVALYTILMFWSVAVADFQHHHGDFFGLHVLGMWISFVLLAGIVAGFVVRMNATIRRQDALLAEAEKIAAVGTLAANAAHELGTPLATLFVLAEDAGDKAAPIKEQLARCKHIVSRITAAGGVTRAEGGAPVALNAFLHRLAERWKSDRPGSALTAHIQTGRPPRIVGELGLEHALRNLLDNAHDASPGAVSFHASWTAQALIVVIADKGAGVRRERTERMGEAGVSTKPGGLGMGLFLARSVIARLEGTLGFSPAPDGGTLATVTLPLRRLAL